MPTTVPTDQAEKTIIDALRIYTQLTGEDLRRIPKFLLAGTATTESLCYALGRLEERGTVRRVQDNFSSVRWELVQ